MLLLCGETLYLPSRSWPFAGNSSSPVLGLVVKLTIVAGNLRKQLDQALHNEPGCGPQQAEAVGLDISSLGGARTFLTEV